MSRQSAFMLPLCNPPIFIIIMSPHHLQSPPHSLILPPLFCSDFCHISLLPCKTFHFLSASCFALAEEEGSLCCERFRAANLPAGGATLTPQKRQGTSSVEIQYLWGFNVLLKCGGQATTGATASDSWSIISLESQTKITLYFHTSIVWPQVVWQLKLQDVSFSLWVVLQETFCKRSTRAKDYDTRAG